MTINERFATLLKELNINTKEAAEIIGKSEGYVRKLMIPNQSFGIEPVKSILNGIKNINIEWLLTGKGEMLTQNTYIAGGNNNQTFTGTSGITVGIGSNTGKVHVEDNAKEKEEKAHLPTNSTGKGVPYYDDIEATGGIISQNINTPEIPTFYIDYEHFNDCTAYIPVVGDSMYPNYCSGEIIAVKRIYNPNIIQWGETYFVVTNENSNSLRTIKQIHYHEDESKLILRASNPNFKGDTVIDKVDIISLFIIKGKIKRNQL